MFAATQAGVTCFCGNYEYDRWGPATCTSRYVCEHIIIFFKCNEVLFLSLRKDNCYTFCDQ